ncbi:unnamed protein product [Staurois parvus]|uniref:Uncharacterized protein n=1 Tax=Staurois parvus TaxID=386267 RepID=A0ABN9FGH8_9NEOB|nr:unnamed protein product [Staurois parvus]
MSCQSTPVPKCHPVQCRAINPVLCGRGPGFSRGPHEMPLVPFIGFFGLGKDTRAP